MGEKVFVSLVLVVMTLQATLVALSSQGPRKVVDGALWLVSRKSYAFQHVRKKSVFSGQNP